MVYDPDLIDGNKLRQKLYQMRCEKRIPPDVEEELFLLAQEREEEISARNTPMEPSVIYSEGSAYELCPTCSHGLVDDDGETFNFCPNCGQRIQA